LNKKRYVLRTKQLLALANKRNTALDLIIENIGDLVTLHPLVTENRNRNIKNEDLGRYSNAWLKITGGKISDFGTGKIPDKYEADKSISAEGGLVMPGMVDSHTHPIFGGNRAAEFSQRLDGVSYKEIADAGGGIQASVQGSRNASDDELLENLTLRLKRFCSRGITTVEVKSGYGLSVEEELRHLKILNLAKSKCPQTMSVTCLALHAASPEHKSLDSYVDQVVSELLPEVANENLADWVDAFIEDGYFTVKSVEPYARKAKELGMGIRIHADEFTDAGAASAAAEWGAASADHLQFASEESIKKMAGNDVVACVLPGTSLYTAIPYTNARQFLDAGCAVSIASDFNPGSCYIDNLSMLTTLAGLHCGFRPAEAIAAVTWTAATSLNLKNKGALAKGSDADFLIYRDLKTADEWLYDFGRALPDVFIAGEAVNK
jgi:imidazolonepropionase